MRFAFIASALLLFAILALTKLQSGHLALDPHEQLAFERQRAELAGQITAAHTPTLAVLDCAATRLAKSSVLVIYVEAIHHRPELVPDPDHDRAMTDLRQSVSACGSSLEATEDSAHRAGQDLEMSAAYSLLKAGR